MWNLTHAIQMSNTTWSMMVNNTNTYVDHSLKSYKLIKTLTDTKF